MATAEHNSEDRYSLEEVEHIVAREVMKHRLSDLEVKLSSLESNMSQRFTKLEGSIQSLLDQGFSQGRAIKECSDELKEEVEGHVRNEYATKIEMTLLEGKVDRMWAKITVAVTVAFAVVQVGLSALGVT